MFDDFASFLISYKKTKGKEGFYTSGTGATADDPGKETVYGLTRLGEPDSPVWAIVERFRRLPGFPENMRRDPELLKAVQETYYDKYWRPMGCHRLSSQVLKNKLFDAAVNIGVPVLSIMLQYALNCFNKKQTLWADIAVDGHIGGATTTAVEAMLGQGQGERVLWSVLDGYQVTYYTLGSPVFKAIVEFLRNNPAGEWRETFNWGWHLGRTGDFADALLHAQD